MEETWEYILYHPGTGIIMVSHVPLERLRFKPQTSWTNIFSGTAPYNNLVPASYAEGWGYETEGRNTFTLGYLLVPTVIEDGNFIYDAYQCAQTYYSTTYAYAFFLSDEFYEIENNAVSGLTGNYTPDGYTGGTGSVGDLPDDIGGVSVEDAINEALSRETEVSQTAYTVINNITNVYNSYVEGDITYQEAKTEVQLQLEIISEAASQPNATVKDAVNANNAITYGQAVNDVLLQEQEEAFWETRDINSEVSNKVQQSDQEEIDYLNSLIAETEMSISDMSPSKTLTEEQIQTSTEIINGIWENPIIKKIIPVAACFMVVCVCLGIRYKL